MPELPEVEVTRLGIAPHLRGRRLEGAVVRDSRLRLPVNDDLAARVSGQRLLNLRRRGKYLLLDLERGTILIHLGMSGHLRVLPKAPRAEARSCRSAVCGRSLSALS